MGSTAAAGLFAAIILCIVRKRKATKNIDEKSNIDLLVASSVTSEVMSPDQNITETSGERDAREIMNGRLDRAELAGSNVAEMSGEKSPRQFVNGYCHPVELSGIERCMSVD